jgi:hypothetical protein
MASSVPILFLALAAAFLLAVVYWLWRSVRLLASGPAEPGAGSDAHARARDALLEEKEALLRALRDLEMDRDVGKLSARDFERLNRRTRARAREVLRLIDAEAAPHRDRARALMAQAVEKSAGTKPA